MLDFRVIARAPGVLFPRQNQIGREMRQSLAVAVMLWAGASAAGANLIVNGSFEAPSVPVGGYTNVGGGSTAISGWLVVGVDSALTSGSFQQSGITFQAQQGSQWLDLAGVTSNSSASGVRQTVPTAVGRQYQISFYVGSATAAPFFAPATVDLTIGGGQRTGYFNPTGPANALNWKLFTVPFTATGNSTAIEFNNGSASSNYLSAIDNVSLTEVALSGDFDFDGDRDATDIDLLFAATPGAVPPANALYDLNSDGIVNTTPGASSSDADVWVHTLRSTEYGDANLDSKVNFDDLLALAQHYGQPGGWASGNFNGQAGIDFDDLLVVAQHYGFGTPGMNPDTFASDWTLAQSTVPEPTSAAVLSLLLAASTTRRGR